VVTLMCDRSDRYDATFNDDAWLRAQGIDHERYLEVVEHAWTSQRWTG
jgi:cysteine synthase